MTEVFVKGIMAKKIIGIDIGYDSLKLVLADGGHIKKAVSVPMPEQLIRDGRAVSPEAMAELIRSTMKENGMRCSRAALVLPSEVGFIRNVVMPQMTTEQLLYNLPYEFRDYITDELKNYVFDYAMISTPEEMDEGTVAGFDAVDDAPDPVSGDLPETKKHRVMELMAVAAPKSYMEESAAMLRKAGLKLVKAAPAVCSYISLIRKLDDRYRPEGGEYCILDLGYQSIRMHIFKGDRHEVTRVLENGLSVLDSILADAYNVDPHLAHTYLLSNYDDCQNKPVCTGTFDNIAVDLKRAINFYSFSNPESRLNDLWLCGGGAVIASLRAAMQNNLDVRLHPASELAGEDIGNIRIFVQAIGAVL